MVEDEFIELLSTFGYPVFRQGSLTEADQYPDTFFTFWNNAEYENSAYDNDTLNVVYDYDVNVYSNDPVITYSLLRDMRDLVCNNGFRCLDRGHDIGSDENTHTGRGINIIYLNNEN